MALPKQRTVETMSISEARQHFSQALNRVREDEVRIILEKSGIPVAGVVSMSDIRRLEQLERDREARMTDLRNALQASRDDLRHVPADEIEREIGKALYEVDAIREGRPVQGERQ